jgi:hypothetical protein
MSDSPAQRPARLCRTPEECYQAGWDDAADMPPLTPSQIAKLTALWRPYIRRNDAA